MMMLPLWRTDDAWARWMSMSGNRSYELQLMMSLTPYTGVSSRPRSSS